MKLLEYYILTKKSTLLLILAVLSVSCLGQKNVNIDSLLKILGTQRDDSNKVKSLNALSRQCWQTTKYADAKKYASQALAIAEKINFTEGKAGAYYNLGVSFSFEAKYKEALESHFSGLRISEKNKYKKGMADAYNGIAGIYNNQGNFSGSLKNLIAYNSIMQELGDKKGVAYSFNNIGLIYAVLGNYSEAVKNHFASLKIKEEIGDTKGISSSLLNIGLIFGNQGKYEDALNYYYASLKLNEQIGDKLGVALTYNNIGAIYLNKGNYIEALNHCFISLRKYEEIGSKNGIALVYNSIGLIYDKEKKYSEALKSHQASLKIKEEIGDQKGVACSYNNMGHSFINLKQYSEARNYLFEGLSLSKKIGAKDDIKSSYEGLAKLDSATGNWEEAYKYHKLYILYRDSLHNEDNSKKMLQAQLQYEFDKKEDSLHYIQALTNEKLKQQSLLNQQQQQSLLIKENLFTIMLSEKKLQQLELEKNQADFAIEKAESEKKQNEFLILNKEKAIQTLQLKKQKLLQTYLFLVLILFSILSIFIYKNYNARQKLKLQALRNKIASDLHDDVGSTLSSISIFSQMAQQHSREVIPHLETIKQSSQKMLDAMADIVWTINPENDQMEKIVLRMKSFAYELLGAKNIDFEFVADEEVTNLKLLMDERKNLYLIFKEATNNIVKYSGADKAYFSLTATKNKLTFLIQDNGRGFDAGNKYTGNGLKNMRKRAEEIGGELHIYSLPGKGTTVELNVAV